MINIILIDKVKMTKWTFILLMAFSSISHALEPGELPAPTSSTGGEGAGSAPPLGPTSSDGGWKG